MRLVPPALAVLFACGPTAGTTGHDTQSGATTTADAPETETGHTTEGDPGEGGTSDGSSTGPESPEICGEGAMCRSDVEGTLCECEPGLECVAGGFGSGICAHCDCPPDKECWLELDEVVCYPPDEPEPGCAGAEILFVVDGSPTMIEHQHKLVAAATGFVDAVAELVTDVRVMVVDADSVGRSPEGACTDCPTPEDGIDLYFCEDQPCLPLEDCEMSLGAGRRLASDYATACLPPGSDRHLVWGESGSADRLSCLLEVGGGGQLVPELTLSLVAALGYDATHDCNESFWRADTIVVVVVLTDSGDTFGPDMNYILEAFAERKHLRENVAWFPIINDVDVADGLCQEGATPIELLAVSDWYDLPWGSVCAESYVDYLQGQIPAVESTCAQLVPSE